MSFLPGDGAVRGDAHDDERKRLATEDTAKADRS